MCYAHFAIRDAVSVPDRLFTEVNIPPKYTFLMPIPAIDLTVYSPKSGIPFAMETKLLPFHFATITYGGLLKYPAKYTFVLFTAYTDVTSGRESVNVEDALVLTHPVPASFIRCNPVVVPTNTTVGDTTEILLISPNE